MHGFTIGKVAKQAGVKIDTLRFYERQGVIPEPFRTESNYRVYPEDTAHRVRFVKRAQDLGFSLREIKGLLELRATPGARCEDVRQQALSKMALRTVARGQPVRPEQERRIISDSRSMVTSYPAGVRGIRSFYLLY